MSLSVQQIVDCSLNFDNFGCFGGWMGQVFNYVTVNGVTTREEYPDREISFLFALQGPCDRKGG